MRVIKSAGEKKTAGEREKVRARKTAGEENCGREILALSSCSSRDIAYIPL